MTEIKSETMIDNTNIEMVCVMLSFACLIDAWLDETKVSISVLPADSVSDFNVLNSLWSVVNTAVLICWTFGTTSEK